MSKQTHMSQIQTRQTNAGLINARYMKAKQLVRGRRFVECLKRTQYAFIVVVCSIVLVYKVGECVVKYLDAETGTVDRYVHTSDAPFPTVTFCPEAGYNRTAVLNNGIGSVEDVRWNAQWVSKTNASKTPREVYEEMVFDLDQIVHSIGLYFERPVQGQYQWTLLVSTVKEFCGQPMFTPVEYYYSGRCYSFSPTDCQVRNGLLELTFHLKQKTEMFLHHQGQFLSPNSRSRLVVDQGKYTKVAVNHEVVELLQSSPRNRCDGYNSTSTFDSCLNQALEKAMLAEVNCTVPWLTGASSAICTNPDTRRRAFAIYQENRRNQKDLCKTPCTFTNMFFSPPANGDSAHQAGHGWAVLYFRRDIKISAEYFLYSNLSMWAEIGSYVGLLLGASLMNLAWIFSQMLDRFCLEKSQRTS